MSLGGNKWSSILDQGIDQVGELHQQDDVMLLKALWQLLDNPLLQIHNDLQLQYHWQLYIVEKYYDLQRIFH